MLGQWAQAQSLHEAVTFESNASRQFMNVEVPELHRLVDSLQTSLILSPINVMPVETPDARVMRRLDLNALRATFEEMYSALSIEELLPDVLNPRAINDVLNLILEAASQATPNVQTLVADQIGDVLARLNGQVTDDGRQPLTHWGFKFGTDSTLSDSMHVAFADVPFLDGDFAGYFDTSAVDTGAFFVQKPNLVPSSAYYYAAWAENESGIAHGDTLSFVTLPGVTTQAATGVSGSSGTLNAKITYGSITPTASGFRWGLLEDLSAASDTLLALASDSTISLDLIPQQNDEVFFVAYSTNDAGTQYGDTLSFVAVADPCFGIEEVTYNGYTYPVASIGDGCYFAENLRTTSYSTGASIIDYLSSQYVGLSTSGFYGNYGDDDANAAIHGRMYDAYAVLNPAGLCPQYWAVPSKEEVEAVFEALGGLAAVGDSLKSSASDDPAWDGSNAFGFGASAGGFRSNPGGYPNTAGNAWEGLNSKGRWWTRTETLDAESAVFFAMESGSDAVVVDSTLKRFGHSVRCRLNASAPEVATQAAAGVTQSEAILVGAIEDLGGLSVTASGFVWGVTPDLASPNTVISQDSSEVFQAVLSSLEMGATVYYSAFSENEAGTTYGDTLSFSVDPFVPAVFESCGNPVAYDGYNYATVQVEGQCWFAENLRTTKFFDENPIPAGLDTTAWRSTSDPARTVLDEGATDEIANLATSGRLYNFHAVSTSKLCPLGWHVPEDEEWEELAAALGGQAVAGAKMKAPSTVAPGWDGTNASGFFALPNGSRSATTGAFSGGDTEARWWSVTPDFGTLFPEPAASQFYLKSGEDSLLHHAGLPTEGAAVRCVLNARPFVRTQAATDLEPTSAKLKGEILSEGGASVTDAGFIWGEQADLSDGTELTVAETSGEFSANLEALIAGTTYYYLAFATNENGTAYGDTLDFMYTSACSGVQYAGYNYTASEIGNQCWMGKNLQTLTYNNGVPIPTNLTNEEWVSTTSGAVASHGTAQDIARTGRLYNWQAVSTGMLCPSGWRVASDEDWTELAEHLGGFNVAGSKLKSGPINSPSWDGNSFYGYGYAPSGYRNGTDGNVYGAGISGGMMSYWQDSSDSTLLWSSTANGTTEAWSYNMRRGYNGLDRRSENAKHGGAVRCVRGSSLEGDIPTVLTGSASSIVGTTATLNGDLSSDGGQDITQIGFFWSSTPDLSNASFVAGSDSTGAFTASLTGLTPGLTYYYQAYARNAIGNAFGDTLSFYSMNCESVDFDGYAYAVVPIGEQCWFAENLQTTAYRGGAAIATGLNDGAWAGTSNGAMAVYAEGGAGEALNLAAYGRLYNGFAATSGALCPDGWHVPIRAEWEALIAEVGDGDLAGQILKASPTDVPSWDGTNAANFSAQAGGLRAADTGAFANEGSQGAWWSATPTQAGEGWRALFATGVDSVAGESASLTSGFSVRCLQDSIILPPTLRTLKASEVTEETMVLRGLVEDDGGEEVSAVGFVWGLNEDLSDGVNLAGAGVAATDSFAANLAGLTENAFYYYSAYATNGAGTTYGDTLRVNAMTCEPVTHQGHTYAVTPIGADCWFAENLRAQDYNDGETIPSGLSAMDWGMTDEGACSVLGEGGPDEAANLAAYGRLYNGYTIAEDRLCPVGWHVSTLDEWTALVDDLLPPDGLLTYEARWQLPGNSLKSSVDWDGANSTGFSALPGGWRNGVGQFGYEGEGAFFWAQRVEAEPSLQVGFHLASSSSALDAQFGVLNRGRSIRCVKGDNTVLRNPTVSTKEASDIRPVSAWILGEIESDGNADVVARGFVWGEDPDLNDGTEWVSSNDSTAFAAKLTGLVSGTTYYFRAFATNSEGTGYGEILSFEHIPCTPVELGGYTYEVVEIGSTCWFAENLRTLVYNDGDSLRRELSDLEWFDDSFGASAIYGEGFNTLDTTGMMLDTLGLSVDALQLYMDSLQVRMDSLQVVQDSTNLARFGRLYNHRAVESEKLCPTGWHVSTKEEWAAMIEEFGGDDPPSVFKASPADAPAWDGTNSLGLSALPGGLRLPGGEFTAGLWGAIDGEVLQSANFWATDRVVIDGIPLPLGTLPRNFFPGVTLFESPEFFDFAVFEWDLNRRIGASVRCTRD